LEKGSCKHDVTEQLVTEKGLCEMQFQYWMGVLTVTIAIISTGCGGGAQSAQDAPQAAIEKVLATEQTAWNAGDSATYADEYTNDADFINIRGQIFQGKAAVQAQHAKIFAGPFKDSTISIVVRKFTLLSDHAALVDTDQTVTNFKGLPPGIVDTATGTLVTHFKYLAVQQGDGTWKFAAGQNTSQLPNPPQP
jgi:uncharacterized protein (TIGR02246 family)